MTPRFLPSPTVAVAVALTAAFAALLAVVVPAAADPPAAPVFVDVAAEVGLDFVHWNGMTGQLYFAEMMAPGGALFDYDGDGDLDVFVVQGTLLEPGASLADALVPPPAVGGDRLYRHDRVRAADGGVVSRFVDVTAAAGIVEDGYGMGAATGDVDGDGDVDLYVTNFAANVLWRNRGDGTFDDATAAAGVGDERWSTSAAFADVDRDGDLDLYVADYVEFDLVRNPACYASSSRRDYCGPSGFTPHPDRFYRNRGDGTFEDASVSSRIAAVRGPALGVVAEDLDGDGRVDFYVANDGQPNLLWINQGDGTFRDDALFAGVAVNRAGVAEGSMGISLGDLDDDGDLDLVMTHIAGESNTFYRNQGGGVFTDATAAVGLAAATLPATAFGTAWIDVDNDGRLDLAAVNGAVRIREEQAAAGALLPLAESDQLFWNAGGTLVEISDRAGDDFTRPTVGRGLAVGDVDEDGDADLLALDDNGPARLLLNRRGSERPWIGLRLVSDGRDALGAQVTVHRRGAPPLVRRASTDGSYASASDPRLVIGLGETSVLRDLVVRWPDGRRERFPAPPLGRTAVVHQGGGFPDVDPS